MYKTTVQDNTMVRNKGRVSQSIDPLQRMFTGDFLQRLGRFLFVRRLYSFFKITQQSFINFDVQAKLKDGDRWVLSDSSINAHTEEVDADGVSFGLRLPDSMVKEILEHALHTPCIEPGYDRPFLIGELDRDYRLPDGHRVIRGLVQNPMECLAIKTLAKDPFLLQLATAYLGYYPDEITCHLTWSVVCDFPEEEVKKSYPPSNFHYDIAGFNFATAYFYITPVLDEFSGPHLMITGSHKRKPLSMLWKSGRQSDGEVYAYYGADNLLEIKGPAGFGFFQDPSCIHKVKVPTRQNRLLFQIRYS